MMNLLLAVLLPFLITTAEDQAASSIEVVEIFRAETTEELEASLTNGYPMPWLAEILSDENIPEEDRYWLDCRVRAVIAQDLHLFFDQDGHPVRYEADRILPGEDYWRECFIVNFPGIDDQIANPPAGNWAGIGLLVDHYGKEIGEIAISNSDSKLSRDGSVGVTQSGMQGRLGDPGLMNLCFFYPDGTYREFPIHHYRINETVSHSGNLVVSSCIDRGRNEQKVHKLYVFDGNANLLFERILELRPNNGSSSIAISPDDKYLAVATRDPHGGSYPVILFDSKTGEELHRWDVTIGNDLRFSPDSRYLSFSGPDGVIADCRSGEIIWSLNTGLSQDHVSEFTGNARVLHCTRDADIIYWLAYSTSPRNIWTALTCIEDQVGSYVSDFGVPSVSPNGYCFIIQGHAPGVLHWNSAIPINVGTLKDGE